MQYTEINRVQIAVLAKAPIPGLAKTRLIPALGARGSARLQRRLTRMAIRTAIEANLGPVTLWCAPDARHRFFRALHRTTGVACRDQASGDLGERMHAAFQLHCAASPLLLIGTDCPSLSPSHLRDAAQALLAEADAVIQPAEDGGYVLVGLRTPHPDIFHSIRWSTPSVMADTRDRVRTAGLAMKELEVLWDLDNPEDLRRLSASKAFALGLLS